MTVADITLAVFTLSNSVRVLAYVPQITKAATDQSGAKAISFGTWSSVPHLEHLSGGLFARQQG